MGCALYPYCSPKCSEQPFPFNSCGASSSKGKCALSWASVQPKYFSQLIWVPHPVALFSFMGLSTAFWAHRQDSGTICGTFQKLLVISHVNFKLMYRLGMLCNCWGELEGCTENHFKTGCCHLQETGII